MKKDHFRAALETMVRDAGAQLLRYFGKVRRVRHKEHIGSVVCEADLAAEACILQQIRAQFPDDGIIAEESGFTPGASGYTWVVDPLDGTSNFVAGLPWFGAQAGVLQGTKPVAAAMFVPTQGDLFYARAGAGVFKNGKAVSATVEKDARKVLCAFGFDPTANEKLSRENAELLRRVSRGVRNIRATNSLVDFCYTLEGRFGGVINLNTKIWDIVPMSVMLPEAGGRFTDLEGRELAFDLGAKTFGRSYRILGAPRALHSQLARLING